MGFLCKALPEGRRGAFLPTGVILIEMHGSFGSENRAMTVYPTYARWNISWSLRPSSSVVKGLDKRSMPASSTPRCTMAFRA